MVTPTTFKIRFTEFNSVEDDLIQMLLDESYLLLSASTKYQDVMVLYHTAHILTITQSQQEGDSGASLSVSSEAVGSVNTSFNVPTSDDETLSYYMSTSYGQRYLEYKQALSVGNVFSV